jgi:hypothetical protein
MAARFRQAGGTLIDTAWPLARTTIPALRQ